ncbi:hypothetical protein KIN20_026210 [Parelaphostrongylus tenuis]|uniref:Pecanex-like protein n=1 Tax=Parelaphostrongylus tenuis TaxID=148309 RepID=A0AAD5N0A1_PARTN|nr:hypothetical protein KIN20_026210 [Parelaphostrongylus tenuis]
MTVTTHIAEILRQGIWASLTGGWYYEPAHSIFCNTVHLYLWLVLLIVPLVVGLVTSGALSLSLLLGYTCFIGVLFSILKTIVARLHVVFDTTEPVITTKVLPLSESRGRTNDDIVEQEDEEGLEMVELHDMTRRVEEEIVADSLCDQSRIQVENELTELENLDEADVMVGKAITLEQPDSDEDTKNTVVEVQDVAVVEDAPNSGSEFELDISVDETSSDDVDSPTNGGRFSAGPRKMSEPLITPAGRQGARPGSDAASKSKVRRSNSTFEASTHSADKDMLRRSRLDHTTRKSYPSKMSSTDEFHTGGLRAKSTKKDDIVDPLSDAGNSVCHVPNAESSLMFANSTNDRDDFEIHEVKEKATSEILCESEDRSSESTIVSEAVSPSADAVGDIESKPRTRKTKRMGNEAAQSSSDWYPVVVSLGETSRSGSTSISKVPDERESGADIKLEITKFLEELIEKHPETLDVIENVRQSRLGRNSTNRVPQMLRMHGVRSRRRSSSSSVSALSDMALRDGTHVASGHEDTSQGAVHSFQDADGMWWTYAFDEHGVGTAQPLGSGRALMELLQSAQDHPAGRNRLDVLPESAYVSSEDEGEPCSSRTATDVPAVNVGNTRRERALSSSSNESYTYIPQLPTTVFHAPTGTGASRANFRREMVSFANVASRLRAAVRNTESIALSSGDLPDTTPHQLSRSILDRRDGRRDYSGPPFHENFLTRLDSGSSTGGGMSTRFRFFSELGLAVLPTGGTNPGVLSGECPPSTARRASTVKKSYYYKMKMFPKTNKSFKLKLDRLSVSALFDRNRSVFSCIFDVFLACLISFLAGLVLATGIYFDIWLFVFAFTVAGAHFSLLKSVQPDASSPIHGFNWLVAYSRPLYFCIGAVIVLMFHHFCDDPRYDKIPWNWNPYRLYETSGEMILLAFRDLFATFLVMLPFAFTMGWLPQINTLTHHLLEQIEMHIFGGTASLGVFSALLQIIKSLLCWALLGGLCHLAYSIDSKTTQTPAYSAFLSVAVATSYLLSRFSSNPQLFLILCRATVFRSQRTEEWSSRTNLCCVFPNEQEDNDHIQDADELDVSDPLPERLRSTVVLRARHDVLFSTFLSLMVFALHSTSLFTATQPYFTMIIVPICVVFGIMNHYIYQQLRTHTPWKLIAKPVLHSNEYTQYESTNEAKLMTFEIIHVWMLAVEKNFLYPLVAVAMLTECGWLLPIARVIGPLIILRFLRGGFSHPQLIYMPLALAFTISHFDWSTGPPFGLPKLPHTTFPMVLYVLIVLYPKWLELYLKMSFVMAYVAPWQISWGSAFHAFAQPFSIPHSALIWTQTVLSSLLSAPLNPFLGSSFFITSYVRPVKFWERDYNTRRSDASNTTLASQIDRGPMLDDSNLNAVFYEHLTRSLQKSLAGDLQMGRWSTSVQPGDCFILASFYLNCLVHIIEVGNGFVTFQLRGLEFRGTYCHQREVEAISDDQSQGTGCCCCAPGSLPGFLSLNTAWSLRWLAWEVVTGKYIIDGYSITDNSAVNLLQVHELRRLLVTLYVKCIVYYTLASSKLQNWLSNDTVRSTLEPVVANPRYVDVDHLFCSTNDEDFDMNEMGISRSSFTEWYSSWISYCISRRLEKNSEEVINSEYVTCLCFVLSLLGRRALGAASYNRHSNAAESFLCGLHALFKGDFRITCQRDEWVFADMDLLRCVIAPAVKMALKLHQDHFAAPDDFDDAESLFNLIAEYQTKLFISHEHDPAWRRAIIANTPSLLALRHMYDEGQDDYKIIMLNRMHLNMRVIKLNRECVRAFWAGQQQELIFLRNRNPERGSIQNARQVLRNMINSSADQPVGYPIYVSPLTTSFVETHSQMSSIVGPPVTIEEIFSVARRTWSAMRAHFGPSGSSSFGLHGGCGAAVPAIALQQISTIQSTQKSVGQSEIEDRTSTTSAHMENSVVHMTPDGGANKFSSTDPVLQAVSKKVNTDRKPEDKENIEEEEESEEISDAGLWVRINDLEQPLKCTGEPLVLWPSEEIRQISGRNSWCCQPMEGLMGRVMFTWYPNHPNRRFRSHIGDAIYLVASPEMSRALVPVSEKGCSVLTHEQVSELQSGENRKEYVLFMKKIQSDLENL